MTDVNDEDKKLVTVDQIEDPITPHSIRVTALKFAFKRLALERILLEIIEGLSDPLIQGGFPFGHPTKNPLGLIGQIKLIAGQGSA